MELMAARSAMPLMEVPFGTSIVLALGSPEVEAAQPRALVGGHLVTGVVGLMVVTLAARSLGRRRSRSAQSRCRSSRCLALSGGASVQLADALVVTHETGVRLLSRSS